MRSVSLLESTQVNVAAGVRRQTRLHAALNNVLSHGARRRHMTTVWHALKLYAAARRGHRKTARVGAALAALRRVRTTRAVLCAWQLTTWRRAANRSAAALRLSRVLGGGLTLGASLAQADARRASLAAAFVKWRAYAGAAQSQETHAEHAAQAVDNWSRTVELQQKIYTTMCAAQSLMDICELFQACVDACLPGAHAAIWFMDTATPAPTSAPTDLHLWTYVDVDATQLPATGRAAASQTSTVPGTSGPATTATVLPEASLAFGSHLVAETLRVKHHGTARSTAEEAGASLPALGADTLPATAFAAARSPSRPSHNRSSAKWEHPSTYPSLPRAPRELLTLPPNCALVSRAAQRFAYTLRDDDLFYGGAVHEDERAWLHVPDATHHVYYQATGDLAVHAALRAGVAHTGVGGSDASPTGAARIAAIMLPVTSFVSLGTLARALASTAATATAQVKDGLPVEWTAAVRVTDEGNVLLPQLAPVAVIQLARRSQPQQLALTATAPAGVDPSAMVSESWTARDLLFVGTLQSAAGLALERVALLTHERAKSYKWKASVRSTRSELHSTRQAMTAMHTQAQQLLGMMEEERRGRQLLQGQLLEEQAAQAALTRYVVRNGMSVHHVHLARKHYAARRLRCYLLCVSVRACCFCSECSQLEAALANATETYDALAAQIIGFEDVSTAAQGALARTAQLQARVAAQEKALADAQTTIAILQGALQATKPPAVTM
ncbi:hypothetical protein EON66_02715 [archaeon]|nr:MAG: hypothetical protein EON66_02715 [archaeon]